MSLVFTSNYSPLNSCFFCSAIVTNEDKSTGKTSDGIKEDDTGEVSPACLKLGLSGRATSNQAFLLCGRRRKKSKTYLIGCDPFDISRNNCVAKLKSNVLGTQFNALRHVQKVFYIPQFSSFSHLCYFTLMCN